MKTPARALLLVLTHAALVVACGTTRGEPIGPADAPGADAAPAAQGPAALGPDAGAAPDAAPVAPASSCPAGSWCWVNPTLTGDNLHWGWRRDWNDVWATSERGTIFHYDGTSWRADYQPPAEITTHAMFGTAADDVWVAAEDVAGGFVLRYDGTRWTRLDPYDPPANAIWGSSKNDVWMVGDGITHFDGAHFSRSVPSAVNADPFNAALADVWGSGPNDAWTITAGAEVLMHWDGTSWTPDPAHRALLDAENAAMNFVPSQSLRRVAGLSGSGPNDVWEVHELDGIENGGNVEVTHMVFNHFDGHAWTTRYHQRVPAQCEGWPFTFAMSETRTRFGHRVVGSGQGSLFAAGVYRNYCTWTLRPQSPVPMVLPSAANAFAGDSTGAWALGPAGTLESWWDNGASGGWTAYEDVARPWVEAGGLAVNSPNDAWILGAGPTGNAELLHWDGLGLATVALPRTVPAVYQAVAARGRDVWLAGADSTNSFDGRGVTAHFDGASWTITKVPDTGVLYGAWTRAADDTWIVGQNDAVLHWNGAGWARVASPLGASACLTSVQGRAADDVWITGGGALNGGGWWCDGLVVLHWDGHALNDVSAALPPEARSERVRGAPLALAGGDLWTIVAQTDHAYRFHDGAWSLVGLGDGNAPLAVWAASEREVWFGGSHGVLGTERASVVRWDGVSVVEDISSTPGAAIHALAGSGPHDLWAGGPGGAILRSSGR